MPFIIKYWLIGRVGYYYVMAHDRQKAIEIFYYARPDAQLIEITEKK